MSLYKKYQATDVPIGNVLEYMSGNTGLTEQLIYQSLQQQGKRYTVLSSSTEENTQMGTIPSCEIEGKTIKVFEGKEGLLVIRKGKAGMTKLLPKGDYTINDDAYILSIIEKCPYKVRLKCLRIEYRNAFLDYASSSDNGTWNMTGFFKNVVIDIPELQEQLRIVAEHDVLEQHEQKIKEILTKIDKINAMQLSHSYKEYQAQAVTIETVIDYMSGNSGLTERFIYEKSQHEGKKYAVLSSSTEEDTKMGEIPACEMDGEPLKLFENKEGLLVIRNGKAGNTVYLTKGNYTINDHAYILFVKEKCPHKIHLKWLSIQYKKEFLDYSSSSDNGTWNMTGFFKNVTIDIPKYQEQLQIISEYEELEQYEKKLHEIQERITHLSEKMIV